MRAPRKHSHPASSGKPHGLTKTSYITYKGLGTRVKTASSNNNIINYSFK